MLVRRGHFSSPLRIFLIAWLLHDVTTFTASPIAHTTLPTTRVWQNLGAKQPLSKTALSMVDTDTRQSRFLPKRFVKIYAEYAGRLWNETNPDARKRIANDKVAGVLRQMQGIKFTDVSPESLRDLDAACDAMHNAIANTTTTTTTEAITTAVEGDALTETKNDVALSQTEKLAGAVKKKKRKGRRSITFGAVMGLVVACWVFSGNYIFTGLFTLMTVLGQLEYYRMVMNTGLYPARRISVVGACSMFLTALFAPDLHQVCLPLFGLWAMVWFLTMKRTVTSIPEIATTFTGMFYLGYVPSFWVRIRLIGGGREPTRLAPIVGPFLRFVQNKAEATLPAFIPQAIHLPITTGAIFIFWSWLCLAFSDVGAYFVGKNFGKTKLGQVSPAAGATSPNKSVEGVLGGCATSGLLGILGAWVQRWPFFFWTGLAHGVTLGLLGLIGDLTASMLKRDAGLKDFGDLIPEHGGIMDRVDSFIWTAPYSWLICAYVIPALKKLAAP